MDFWEFYLEHQDDEGMRKIAEGINEARDRFIKDYPLERLKTLSLEEYATGLQNKDSLCYRIEFGDLKTAGPAIGGGSAFKFGIYWDKEGKRYRFFDGKEIDSGRDPEEKWREIRAALVGAIESVGRAKTPEEILDDVPALKNMPQVVTKLVYCYYPEKMLGVSGKRYLVKILQKIGVKPRDDYSAVKQSFFVSQKLREVKPSEIIADAGMMAAVAWEYAGGKRERWGNGRKKGDQPEEVINDEETTQEYDKTRLLEEVFITEQEYDDIAGILRWKKNIVLQGAPGVGKTFLAKRLAYAMMGEKAPERVECVQFHQSYGYEDFVEGYRPDGEGGFVLKPGILREFTEKALSDAGHDYFLIIDEINRGNLSKIFGELMMLTEGDKRSEDYAVTLQYSGEKFYLPENLYIIGTMNTADRSLAMIDYALRRRFSFITLLPAFEKSENTEKMRNFLRRSLGLKRAQIERVMRDFQMLNAEIGEDLGEGFKIGHSYVTIEGLNSDNFDEVYAQILQYEIKPLLEEYYFDRPERVEVLMGRLEGGSDNNGGDNGNDNSGEDATLSE